MTVPATSTDIFDTNVLVGVVRNLKLPSTWLLDKFFPRIVESDTEFVSIDVEIGKRRMAPFVSPLVRGQTVEARRVQTNTFRPAYIKDRRTPDLKRPIRRAIGERIGGAISAQQRMEQNLVYELEDQVQMIQRRLEWMAAQSLQNGTVTIVGEGFPSTLVDFGRDSALTVTLTSTAVWSATNITNATATPADNITDWVVLVLQKSGAEVTDVVFTPKAWKLFKRDQSVKDAVWFPRSGDAEVKFSAQGRRGAVPLGQWDSLTLWLYNDWYVDPADNTEKPQLVDGTILLGSPDIEGVRAFGVIEDPDFAYGPLAYAPKTWVEKDPAQRIMLMQSAPLVFPSRPNASMAIKVA